MATPTPKVVDAALTGSLVAVYTCPAGTVARVVAVTACNDSGAVVALTVQLQARTGSTTRTVIDERNLADRESHLGPEVVSQYLEAGGVMTAMGNGIKLYVSLVEITV